MSLAQLANLGEFVGGLAVLVTLIYLAVQVRQSTDLAQGTRAAGSDERLSGQSRSRRTGAVDLAARAARPRRNRHLRT
jgi:hypothetical protein